MILGNNFSVIRLFVMIVIFVTAHRVYATPYVFSVDHIRILGNLPVFAEDGFDDGVIAPWTLDHMTVVESGGLLTLSSPGVVETMIYDNYLITDEESQIHLDNILGVKDGAGDLLTTSQWVPILPAQDQLYGMEMYIAKPLDSDSFFIDIGIYNMGPLMAEILGASTGLNIAFVQDIDGADVDEDIYQFFPIAAEDVTGDILFSLHFNDNSDLFTGGFSLDGGSTFLKPFAPISTQMSDAVFENWEFYADSFTIQTIPEPASLFLLATGLVGLGFGRLKMGKVQNALSS